MKKNNRKKVMIVLLCIHELLLIITGMGLALMIEAGKIANGAGLIIPMAFLLITCGWILRGSFEDIKG